MNTTNSTITSSDDMPARRTRQNPIVSDYFRVVAREFVRNGDVINNSLEFQIFMRDNDKPDFAFSRACADEIQQQGVAVDYSVIGPLDSRRFVYGFLEEEGYPGTDLENPGLPSLAMDKYSRA